MGEERKRKPVDFGDATFAQEVANSLLTPEERELIDRWNGEVGELERQAFPEDYILEEASKRVPGAADAILKEAKIAEQMTHKGGQG